jgi:site-specific recombinase XerD
VRFENLRHTFGTRLAAEGYRLEISKSGWDTRTIRTTQIYAAYEPREHEVEALNEAFSEVRLDP